MTNLSVAHQTTIQALLSRGPLKEKDFHDMFKGLTGKNPATNQDILKEFLLKINKALSYVHFELRATRNQYDGEVYYGVVNNVSDEQSKLGTKYSVPQIAFYKAIVETIVQDYTACGLLPSIRALNLRLENQVVTETQSQSRGGLQEVPSALKNFSTSQKSKTLDELVQDQWLHLTADGNVALGVRSFLDLRSWFRNNDVPSCEVCNEAGVKAELCQNEACSVRIHHYCLSQLFSRRKVERVCPSCGANWLGAVPKVEATGDDDDQTEPRQNEPQSVSQRKRPRALKTSNEDISGSTPSQPSVTSSEPRKITRKSARLQ